MSFAAALALCGCSPGYVMRQARGQLRLLRRREPIEKAAARLGPEARSKLDLIAEARRFGEERIGLAKTRSFTTYVDLGDRPVTYVVSACPKDSLEPVTWWFPIAGKVPYKGYFERAQAEQEKAHLESQDLDVALGGAAAYSTLGWFSDPVYSTMLEMSDFRLAELVLHEMTHATVYSRHDGDFNEALATFVGGEAALRFFRERRGEDSPGLREGKKLMERDRRVDAVLKRAKAELEALYRSPKTREEKLRERAALFASGRARLAEVLPGAAGDGPLDEPNNAKLLAELRYSGVEAVARAFEEEERDFARFFARARRAAKAEDPFAALPSSRAVIVALGDSTTAGTPYFRSPVEAPPDGRGDERGAWGYWLTKARPEWKTLNRGVNGERTDEIRARFERDVLAEHPRYVVILGGVNDVYQGRPAEETRTDLSAMYRAAKAAGIVPVAATVLPFDLATPEQSRAIRALNAWIEKAAAEEGLPFCDTNAAAADPGRPERLSGTAEGLHPDIATYRKVGEAVARCLAEAERGD